MFYNWIKQLLTFVIWFKIDDLEGNDPLAFPKGHLASLDNPAQEGTSLQHPQAGIINSWGWDKMVDVLQMSFSDAFSWMKIVVYFHSNFI